MKTDRLHFFIYSLLGALIVTAIAGLGALKRPDKWLQDVLYQSEGVSMGDIVIIGIDEKALGGGALGPYNTWDRNIMAEVLEVLGSDPEKRPAVVAIDTLYSGHTTEEADRRLAEACRDLNVVTATAASFGRKNIVVDGQITMDNFAILSYEEPYGELKAVTTQGHINSMEDIDGIMRHALLYVEPGDGQRVYSMAYQVARIYMEQYGQTPEYPEVNARGFFYVPFTARPETYYEGVSVLDILYSGGYFDPGEDGSAVDNDEDWSVGDPPVYIDPDYYAGKIVLIGPYASGLQDAYFTPIDRGNQMFGVEFQANVIQSLIEGVYLKEAPSAPQLVVMFLVCFAALYLFFDRKVLSSFIICIVMIGLSIGAVLVFREFGIVIHPLWIPSGILILYVVSVAAHYFKAAQDRAQVTRTFERYVAPEIVREIMKEGMDNLSLGGKTCDIAVLFVDVRGFTTMSERLSPEEVVFILNRYLTMTSSCVEKNSGTLDKFVGDATMAFWGAPLPQEDAVYLACRTALDIVAGAAEVSRQLKEEIGEELRVGVGVHYGPAVVGNMGSEKHMDYTAIGDTVNTSARLEANAPGGTVYISRKVADELGGRATYESLGDSVKLKGKADGFEVLKLLTLKEKDDA
ncbi:MAG: adenylate/guanylate cyclase domain-containing protein [Clostridiales bacterium]|nr:adenylate/guanylate cyclase domain-containing protein [Clostridiales bacterium]